MIIVALHAINFPAVCLAVLEDQISFFVHVLYANLQKILVLEGMLWKSPLSETENKVYLKL